jgi:NADH dehydrogenase/NADH:ubiquinone oxidoreductase subunit G
LKAVLDRSENVVLLDFAKSELLKYGNVAVALPTLTTFEKSGTLVNKDGIHQKFLPVMEPVNFGRNEAEVLGDLARELQHAPAHPAGSGKTAATR